MKCIPILFCVTLFIGCTGDRSESADSLYKFIKDWSVALSSGNEQAIRNFYEPGFPVPELFFNSGTENLSIEVLIDRARIESSDETGIYDISLPITVTSQDKVFSKTATIDLVIVQLKEKFQIRQMTRELVSVLKEYSLRMKANNRSTTEYTIELDSALKSSFEYLRSQFDSVIFFAALDTSALFFVVRGKWENPFGEAQLDKGDYKVGVVRSDNTTIVPVEYDKVYNPNGSFEGFIEVEKKGKRGLFSLNGNVFLETEYDAIYPVDEGNVMAQVRQDGRYGWVDQSGRVNFDSSTHSMKELFQSPLKSDLFQKWKFKYPGKVILWRKIFKEEYAGDGVIIYPSYLRDFGIARVAQNGVVSPSDHESMGVQENVVEVNEVKEVSNGLFALISFFMETGIAGREYHFSRNELIVVNDDLDTLSRISDLVFDDGYREPCHGEKYQAIDSCLYEVKYTTPSIDERYNVREAYKYYLIDDRGNTQRLKSNRQYPFTKYVKMDRRYFERCAYKYIEENYQEWSESKPNVVIFLEYSSDELDVMRNEIFADYGYIFKTDKWRTYFSGKSWYEPRYDNVDELLTPIDKHNVQLILEYQKEMKSRTLKVDSVFYVPAG